MSDKQEGNVVSVLENISQVKDSNQKRNLNKTTKICVIGIIVVMISFAYLTSNTHARQKTNAQVASNTNNSHTLEDNLSLLERMKKEAANQKPNSSHNYTSTPDGLKIGNPRAYRKAPAPKAEIDSETATRMNAPTTFIHIDDEDVNRSHKNPELGQTTLIASRNTNAAFLNTKNAIEMVEAAALPHPEYVVAAGESIPATLEVAMNSELPGLIRAITSRDVYSLTGNHLLIPKGSKLIGQYSSGNLSPTQSRFLLSWTRVQLPNGVVVTLNSPSVDTLGRSGSEADTIDRHVMARFSTGILFSVLGAATATAGVNPQDEFNSASQYRSAVANSLQETARESLQRSRDIQSTLEKYQGAAINVFVARDLSFYNVRGRTR